MSHGAFSDALDGSEHVIAELQWQLAAEKARAERFECVLHMIGTWWTTSATPTPDAAYYLNEATWRYEMARAAVSNAQAPAQNKAVADAQAELATWKDAAEKATAEAVRVESLNVDLRERNESLQRALVVAERQLAEALSDYERSLKAVHEQRDYWQQQAQQATIDLAGQILATLSIELNKPEPIGHPNLQMAVESWKKRLDAIIAAHPDKSGARVGPLPPDEDKEYARTHTQKPEPVGLGYKDLTKTSPDKCPHDDIVGGKCVDCGCWITLAEPEKARKGRAK